MNQTWGEESRWVIPGSRLLSHFQVWFAIYDERRNRLWHAPKRPARRSLPESKRRGGVWLPSRRYARSRSPLVPGVPIASRVPHVLGVLSDPGVNKLHLFRF
jgi:hypothetical protein